MESAKDGEAVPTDSDLIGTYCDAAVTDSDAAPATDSIVIATDGNSVATATEVVAGASDVVSAASDAVLTASAAVPAASDAVPAASDSVPAASDAVPAASDAVLAASDATPAASDVNPSSLSALLAARARRLRPCLTTVTRADGRCYGETRSQDGAFVPTLQLLEPLQQHQRKTAHSQAYASAEAGTGSSEVSESVLGGVATLSLCSGEFIPQSHLQYNLQCPGFVIDTKPDLRCSVILPYLLLGSQDVAHDPDLLRQYRVTHVLSLLPPSVFTDEYLVLTPEGRVVALRQDVPLGRGGSSSRKEETREHFSSEKNNIDPALHDRDRMYCIGKATTGDSGGIVTVHVPMLDVPEHDILDMLDVCHRYIMSVKNNCSDAAGDAGCQHKNNTTDINCVSDVCAASNATCSSCDRAVVQDQCSNECNLNSSAGYSGTYTRDSHTSATVRNDANNSSSFSASGSAPESSVVEDRFEDSLDSDAVPCSGVRTRGSVVLVHCNAGVSRAPAVVVAHLMARFGWSYRTALERVKQARPFVRPNDGFVKQLVEYELRLRGGGADGGAEEGR